MHKVQTNRSSVYLKSIMPSGSFSECQEECIHVITVLWPACTSSAKQSDQPRHTKIAAEPVSTIIISKAGTLNWKRKPPVANFNDNR